VLEAKKNAVKANLYDATIRQLEQILGGYKARGLLEIRVDYFDYIFDLDKQIKEDFERLEDA